MPLMSFHSPHTPSPPLSVLTHLRTAPSLGLHPHPAKGRGWGPEKVWARKVGSEDDGLSVLVPSLRPGGSLSAKMLSFLRRKDMGLCSYLHECESRPQPSFPEGPTHTSCPYSCHAARALPGRWPSPRDPQPATDRDLPEASTPASPTCTQRAMK